MTANDGRGRSPEPSGVAFSYHDPEQLLDDDEVIADLVEATDDAFGSNDWTEAELEAYMREHVVPHDFVLTAADSERFYGFVSMSPVATEHGRLIYTAGAAVRSDHQGQGLGRLLHVGGLLRATGEADAEVYVGSKTQNPVVLSHWVDQLNGHPQPDAGIPEDVGNVMDVIATHEADEAEYDRPVIKNVYDDPLYDEKPDHELAPFLDSIPKFDYRNGDAIILVGQVSRVALEATYEYALEAVAYEFEEGPV